MKTKTLIYSTIGIFALFTGAYIFISPIATKTLDMPVVANTDNEEQQATSTEEIKKEEQQISTETKQVIETKTAPQVTTIKETPSTPSGYTMAEVSVHNTVNSCWSVVDGNVYDLTSYISRHPGGEKNILRICGKDGSSAFEGQHGGESKPEKILASYKIGPLK